MSEIMKQGANETESKSLAVGDIGPVTELPVTVDADLFYHC